MITGLVGNWLVQRWQLRNWFSQQRHTSDQQELSDLTALFDEVSKSASARLNVMRSLLNDLRSGSNVENSVLEYKKAIGDWNISLHSWFARITFLINWETTISLERDLHAEFVGVGAKLEVLIRDFRSGGNLAQSRIAQADKSLNSLTGQLDRFLKLILRHIQEKRSIIRNGRHIFYNRTDLAEYTTLDLVKALFVSDVDKIDIIRPS